MKLAHFKWVSSDEADWAIIQYDAFIDNEVVINREEFKNFDFEVQSVYDVLGLFLHKKFYYPVMSYERWVEYQR